MVGVQRGKMNLNLVISLQLYSFMFRATNFASIRPVAHKELRMLKFSLLFKRSVRPLKRLSVNPIYFAALVCWTQGMFSWLKIFCFLAESGILSAEIREKGRSPHGASKIENNIFDNAIQPCVKVNERLWVKNLNGKKVQLDTLVRVSDVQAHFIFDWAEILWEYYVVI